MASVVTIYEQIYIQLLSSQMSYSIRSRHMPKISSQMNHCDWVSALQSCSQLRKVYHFSDDRWLVRWWLASCSSMLLSSRQCTSIGIFTEHHINDELLQSYLCSSNWSRPNWTHVADRNKLDHNKNDCCSLGIDSASLSNINKGFRAHEIWMIASALNNASRKAFY